MFRNLLKSSLRSILRNKLFSTINIVGLSISMSVCLLVIALIVNVKSYDTFHEKGNSIYRVITHRQALQYPPSHFASTTLALLPSLEADFPEIENAVGLQDGFATDMSTGERIVPVSGMFMGQAFFDIFSFEWISGSQEDALSEPFSIVLTENAAIKLFGDEDPIGKMLTSGEGDPYRVTGLMANAPQNSHIKFESLVSLPTRTALEARGGIRQIMNNWEEVFSSYIYVELREDAAVEGLNTKLAALGKDRYADNDQLNIHFTLQPLGEIMTGPELSNQLGLSLPPVLLIILTGLAAIIILTATFNYTNLSLARSIRRAKEVGVRKVIGARRRQVLFQFLLESVLIALAAFGIGYVLFLFIRDMFLGLAPELSMIFSLDVTPRILINFVLFTLLVGVIAGLLPSIILSKVKALTALRNTSGLQLFRHVNLKKVLLATQFVFALLFINAAFITSKQYKFTQTFDLGYDTENIINVSLQGNDPQTIANEFSQLSEVEAISFSAFIPSTGTASSVYVKYQNPLDSLSINELRIDENYLNVHNFEIVSGENFEKRINSDAQQSVIVNERFLTQFGIESADEALGQVVNVGNTDHFIRGVVRDFHYDRLNRAIGPFIFRYSSQNLGWANIKIQSTDLAAVMDKMEATWQKVDPLHELNSEFFEDRIARAYADFELSSKIIGFVSILAISISGLGLLGMAVYIVETRLKEVSIRKVLGANEGKLMLLLSRTFTRMLIISSLIALPITFFLFDQLVFASYANRISLGITDLLIGVILIGIMALLTAGSQIYKAANSNPAEHLRSE